jgi:hypothetical protein
MWRHDTLKSCKFEIGVGYIELDAEGVVVSPSPYALDVLRRYGNVTGFTFSEEQEPVTQDTTSEVADAPNEAKPKRRRTTRKTAKD